MDTSFRLFPRSASTAAAQVDQLYFFLLLVSAFFTLLIFFSIVYFAFHYRHGAKVDRSHRPGARYWLLEVIWSLIPLGLTMIMFAWGADLFFEMNSPPSNTLDINVLGKQWMWKVQHGDGRQEINSIHLPVDTPVKLRMISEDVIHSFYIPDFRVKQDVLPGRYTTLWFEPTKTGRYHLFCAEYCGTSHSQMIGEVVVLEPAEYANWLQGGTSESPEAAGQALFEEFRCGSCHAVTINPRCPPLDGLFGREVQLADGSTVQADEDYVRESILHPAAKVVKGYQPIMPSYEGQMGEEEVFQIIAYLKSLPAIAQEPPAREAGINGEGQP